MVGDADLSFGLLPRIIVYFNGTGKQIRAFHHRCDQFGVSVIPCQYKTPELAVDDEWAGEPFAFDCAGIVSALEQVAALPNVIRVENAINVRVGQIACGTGDEKIRSSPPRPKPNLRSNANPGRFDPSAPHRI